MDTKTSAFEVISFIASIASPIVAVGAIWLSVVFYRMSTTASNATTQAAGGIAASVERLERLFDKLYSDTISMTRDTVSDMRKHMWPADDPDQEKAVEESEKKADQKIEVLKDKISNQISELSKQQRLTDSAMSGLRDEMRSIVDRAIVSSRQVDVEAREETLREHLLRAIRVFRRTKPRVLLGDVVERLQLSSFELPEILEELEN